MSRVVVVDYDPGWPKAFERLREKLLEGVSDVALAVEHVGSTSVPGLAAKPVIDIDVIVPAGRVPDGIRGLESLGYRHQGDLGIPGREAFRRPPETPRHHLYLCPEGSSALANHLAVRDYLRAHPRVRDDYASLKRALAARFADDIDGYVDGKTSFLIGVLRDAGLGRAALDEIESLNRRP